MRNRGGWESGKTTTTRAILQALHLPPDDYVSGNNNYRGKVGVALLRASRRRRRVVIEVGIKKLGEMASMLRPIGPNIVVVTCVSSDHILSFRDQDPIRDEKSWAVRLLGPEDFAVLNYDDPRTRWMAGITRAKVIWYGFERGVSYRGNRMADCVAEARSALRRVLWPLRNYRHSTPDAEGELFSTWRGRGGKLCRRRHAIGAKEFARIQADTRSAGTHAKFQRRTVGDR